MQASAPFLSVLAVLLLAPGARADALNGLRRSVARVGDVNGDGLPDVAIGAEHRRTPWQEEGTEPCARVRSGKDASSLWMLRHVDLRQ